MPVEWSHLLIVPCPLTTLPASSFLYIKATCVCCIYFLVISWLLVFRVPQAVVNVDSWSYALVSSFVCLVWLKHNFRALAGPALKWFPLGSTEYH